MSQMTKNNNDSDSGTEDTVEKMEDCHTELFDTIYLLEKFLEIVELEQDKALSIKYLKVYAQIHKIAYYLGLPTYCDHNNIDVFSIDSQEITEKIGVLKKDSRLFEEKEDIIKLFKHSASLIDNFIELAKSN